MLQALEHNMVDAIIIASTQPDYDALKNVISGNIPYLFIDRKLQMALRLNAPDIPPRDIILPAQFYPKEKVPQLLY